MNDVFSSRRNFLRSTACGFGYLAWAGMATAQAEPAKKFENPLAPRKPHFDPKVKRVIFMFMQGAPSQHETFDFNPELSKAGEGEGSGGKKSGKVLPSVYKFNRHGESGLYISEIFPNLAKHADDLCLLNGMHTDSPAHPQASIFMHTGSVTFVRPSIGSWVVYGLGTENQDLPGFVTMNPAPIGGAQSYGSAFLPATYQGTKVAIAKGESPIENIRNSSLSSETQRKQIDFLQGLNRDYLQHSKVDTEVEGLIESYELAFRMQTSVPKVLDIAGESAATKEMYG